MGDFRVVSAAEVADEIVKRLACNELPVEAGEWIREQAKHGEHWGQYRDRLWPRNLLDALQAEA